MLQSTSKILPDLVTGRRGICRIAAEEQPILIKWPPAEIVTCNSCTLYTTPDTDADIQQYKSCLGSLEMVYICSKNPKVKQWKYEGYGQICVPYSTPLSMCVCKHKCAAWNLRIFLRLQRFFSTPACAYIIGEVFFYFTNNFTRILHKYGSRPAGIPLFLEKYNALVAWSFIQIV